MIYGAGGAVGGAVARVFAQEGARVFLTGRNLSNVDGVAKEIVGAHGRAESAQVDALDEAEWPNAMVPEYGCCIYFLPSDGPLAWQTTEGFPLRAL